MKEYTETLERYHRAIKQADHITDPMLAIPFYDNLINAKEQLNIVICKIKIICGFNTHTYG